MTRDRARLVEVLDAIGRIERHTAAGKVAFFENDLVHDAVLYRIGSVGESIKGLSTPFRLRHPEVPWKQIAGIRDVVNHQYYGIDLTVVWNTIENDLPALKADVARILVEDPEVAT